MRCAPFFNVCYDSHGNNYSNDTNDNNGNYNLWSKNGRDNNGDNDKKNVTVTVTKHIIALTMTIMAVERSVRYCVLSARV